jgi:transcriptional regulator with XRE-family HTH domain
MSTENFFRRTMFSMDTQQTFGDWLGEEMKKRHLSNADMARLSGLDDGTLSNLVNGRKRPGPDTCRPIAKALDLPQTFVFVQAGLMDVEEVGELSPKMLRIIGKLKGLNDNVLDLVTDQIELVLIPHAEKIIGSINANKSKDKQ